MDQDESGDARMRAKWAKYKARQDQSTTMLVLEDDHDAVELVVRAPAPDDHARPIVLDEDDEEEIVHDAVELVVDENKKATDPRRSKSHQGRYI